MRKGRIPGAGPPRVERSHATDVSAVELADCDYLTGEPGELYRSSAQLFVHQLLKPAGWCGLSQIHG